MSLRVNHLSGGASRLIEYGRLNTYPNQNFTIVLNVNDGPGSSQYPPTDYTAAIQKLKTYSNVKTVGYVHTLYATRNITSVLADVATYAGWGAANATTNAATAGLTVSGIFFDEAPHDYSADALDYMSTINAAVKNAAGIASPKTVSIPLFLSVLHAILACDFQIRLSQSHVGLRMLVARVILLIPMVD